MSPASNRHRLEDLGRIAEMIQEVLDREVLKEERRKWDPEVWDKDRTDAHLMALEDARNSLWEIWQLARFGDSTD